MGIFPAFTLSVSNGGLVRDYLLYSTVAALFSESLSVHFGIDWRIFYLVLAVNLILMVFLWDFRLGKAHLATLLIVFLSGVVAVWRGPDTFGAFLAQFAGITVSSVYFFAFFRTQHRSVEEIFSVYAEAALLVATFGLIESLGFTLVRGTFYPVRSITTEPAHFAILVFPAFAYYLLKAVKGERCKGRAALMGLAVLLSGSAIAFANFLLVGLLVFRKRMTTAVVGLAIALFFLIAVYTADPHTQIRVNDTLKVFQTADVAGSNLSTYALLSNGYVTVSVLNKRPFLGYGLGGHKIAHKQFIDSLPGVEGADQKYLDINATDADSLMLRTASEFGMVGVLCILWFIWAYRAREDGRLAIINISILTYFSLKLLREGTWFSAEMYFFVWAYVFSSGRFAANRLRKLRLRPVSASA
jgi:hypothetical protein